MSLRTYANSTAIVTGAASGIGRALARELAYAGADVVLADLQEELVDEVASQIAADGGRASAIGLDVRDYGQVQSLVNRTFEDKGRLDYLFNNAGVGIGGQIAEHSADDWEHIIDVNVKGVVYGVQAALPPMLQQGFGHIVNTASISGLIPVPGLVAYSATKHAVVGLTKSLRGEVASVGVRVSALCPGAVNTPLLTGGRFGRLYGVSSDVARHVLCPFPPMDPAVFAKKSLAAIKRNKAIVVLPWQFKLVRLVLRCMPTSWEIHLARSHVAKRRKEAIAKTSKANGHPRGKHSRRPGYLGTRRDREHR